MTKRNKQEAFIKGVAMAILRRSVQVAGLLLAALFAIQLYYFIMPGSWFLRSSDISVASSSIGEDIPFDWCRKPLEGLIRADAVRTFSKKQSDGSFKPISQYEFTAAIEPIDRKCQPLTILESRQPQEDGVYFFVTDLTWEQHGYEKHLRYTSNQYILNGNIEFYKKRIAQLEKEIDRLKKLRDELQAKPVMQDSDAPQTARTNVPTTSSPPDSVPATPVPSPEPSRGFVGGTLDSVTNTLDTALNGVTNLIRL